MIDDLLNKYDPKDYRFQNILRFYAENLNEGELTLFIRSIFDRDSWVLPTEISKFSESTRLKKQTAVVFHQIFSKWANERMKFSSTSPSNRKNSYLPKKFIIEYNEALFSIRNLGFPDRSLAALEKFLKSCSLSDLKLYCERSFNLAVENFNEKEIELFFNYFSVSYIKKGSNNIKQFLYSFLYELAYSYKIFNLSSSFVEKLNLLSDAFKKREYRRDYFLVISILHIELITKKTLDVNAPNFAKMIEETIKGLGKSSLDNLVFYMFLKKFDYSFHSFNSELEVQELFAEIRNKIPEKNANDVIKLSSVDHFINNSDQYFELLLFYTSLTSEEFSKQSLVRYIGLIDKARAVFSSSILWFEEFLNFKAIKGRIFALRGPGFEVKIDEDTFKKKIHEMKITASSGNFNLKDRSGFVHKNSLRNYPEALNYMRRSRKRQSRNELPFEEPELKKPDLFLIKALNYSAFNRGSVARLVPYNAEVDQVIKKYQLKAFFSNLELFLIEKASEFLQQDSPFIRKSNLLKRLIPNNIDNIELSISEENFWETLKFHRPCLYKEIYLLYLKNENSFRELVTAFENGAILSGVVKSRTKGGMFVEIEGSIAFLPGSQIDFKPVVDYDSYIGRTLNFKIVKVIHEFKNVVVSHIEAIKPIREQRINKFIKQRKMGQIVEGTVQNITSFGVFVNIGEVTGLIHNTDLSWSGNIEADKLVEIDQKINVIILDLDEDTSRISLGLKQLQSNPWETLDKNLKVSDKVKGKVKMITDYGAFVEVIEGLDGLLHISELSWKTAPKKNNQDESPTEFINKIVKVGDEVETIIMTLDRENRKMSLSLKQLTPDPWSEIGIKYSVGSKHICKVRHILNFGAIVEIEEGIGGLIHISELSWQKGRKGSNRMRSKKDFVKEIVNVGDEVEVKIIELDLENRKIGFSLMQLTPDPWKETYEKYQLGSRHMGIVVKVGIYIKGLKKVGAGSSLENYGVIVELEEEIQGLIRVLDLPSTKKMIHPKDRYIPGEKLEVVIQEIDIERRRLRLSIL